MSINEYEGSQRVAAEIYRLSAGNEFFTLIMAAARFADNDNLEKLEWAFPEIIRELRARYNAPGGVISD